MDHSIFMDRSSVPANENLVVALGKTCGLWMEIREHVLLKYPEAKEGWNYPGKNYAWSFRIKDKKRATICLPPSGKAEYLPESSQTWGLPGCLQKVGGFGFPFLTGLLLRTSLP